MLVLPEWKISYGKHLEGPHNTPGLNPCTFATRTTGSHSTERHLGHSKIRLQNSFRDDEALWCIAEDHEAIMGQIYLMHQKDHNWIVMSAMIRHDLLLFFPMRLGSMLRLLVLVGFYIPNPHVLIRGRITSMAMPYSQLSLRLE